MVKKSQRVLLLVCEGNVTEPTYFERIWMAIKLAKQGNIPTEDLSYCPEYIRQIVAQNQANLFDNIEVV